VSFAFFHIIIFDWSNPLFKDVLHVFVTMFALVSRKPSFSVVAKNKRKIIANKKTVAPYKSSGLKKVGISESSGFEEFLASPGLYYTSKGIALFTMFYCSLNWLMYKNANKHDDKKD